MRFQARGVHANERRVQRLLLEQLGALRRSPQDLWAAMCLPPSGATTAQFAAGVARLGVQLAETDALVFARMLAPPHHHPAAPPALVTWPAWQAFCADLTQHARAGDAHAESARKHSLVIGRLQRSLAAVPTLRTDPRSLERWFNGRDNAGSGRVPTAVFAAGLRGEPPPARVRCDGLLPASAARIFVAMSPSARDNRRGRPPQWLMLAAALATPLRSYAIADTHRACATSSSSSAHGVIMADNDAALAAAELDPQGGGRVIEYAKLIDLLKAPAEELFLS